MATQAGQLARVITRKATVKDIDPILELVNRLALKQIMLPRSPASVVEHIRDFNVVEVDGRFAGCGALHIVWSNLAEIRSLAIDPEVKGRGLGKRLVEEMVEEALALGVGKLFAFTYVQGFFEKCGFSVVEHASLPHKVFQDCLHCPKFNRCDEIAMERVLRETSEPPGQGPLSRPLPSELLPRVIG